MKAIIITPTNSVVNMRETPSPDATTVASLESGDAVEALATQGDWTQVNWKGYNGWVHSDYVVLEKETNELNGKLRNKLKKALKTAINPVAATKQAVKTTRKLTKGALRLAKPKNLVKLANPKNLVKTAVSTVQSATNGIEEEEALNGLFDSIKNAVKSFVSPSTATAGTASAQPIESGMKVGDTMYVNTQTDPLIMHATASKDGSKLVSIPRASAVTIADSKLITEGDYQWCKVNYAGKTGYVAFSYLSVIKPLSTTASNSASQTTDAIINTLNQQQPMTLTDNAKKYIKIGVGAVAVLGVGYLAFKKFGGSKSTSKKKGLSGISRKRTSKKKLYLQ